VGGAALALAGAAVALVRVPALRPGFLTTASGDAPAGAPEGEVTAPGEAAATEAAEGAVAGGDAPEEADPASDVPLYGGRRREWWEQRLTLLRRRAAQSPEGAALYASTLERGRRSGLRITEQADAVRVVPAGATAQDGTSP
jgi:hypothetical protein